ncbi:YqaI family protein [Halobacillus salinus]|uniref:YqaI family protein n=1 Tax=Halobacillus salinus TaxID=192814 RepID=UPI0009A78823|nr:hypothetical protein [Halobacillus salinus]
MDHPFIEQIERSGFPKEVEESNQYGIDGLGNEVFAGDEIYVINDEFFLKETLHHDSRELLITLGAEEKNA